MSARDAQLVCNNASQAACIYEKDCTATKKPSKWGNLCGELEFGSMRAQMNRTIFVVFTIVGGISCAYGQDTAVSPIPAPQSSQSVEAAFAAFEAAAKAVGYDVKVVSSTEKSVDVALSKLSKTEESYGILQKKWDQREFVAVKISDEGAGPVTEVKTRLVERKPPIGPWAVVVEESANAPANVLPGIPSIYPR
jgi:hypothetical protein